MLQTSIHAGVAFHIILTRRNQYIICFLVSIGGMWMIPVEDKDYKLHSLSSTFPQAPNVTLSRVFDLQVADQGSRTLYGSLRTI